MPKPGGWEKDLFVIGSEDYRTAEGTLSCVTVRFSEQKRPQSLAACAHATFFNGAVFNDAFLGSARGASSHYRRRY